ncbi:hypothetical protein MED121_20066 [Marinomonas sp. MED121]|uniref:DUF624 domain-containing protein n=1 Tax=Marinomonas sp. MED121 TaxID=314277 RepID=UPI000069128D|nr:DUF624 domain-containing protein [Marinomonas sp. MED121]EAQ63546.1 hypothetical protein MED121_20066 [Marinomonas sp. MED121]
MSQASPLITFCNWFSQLVVMNLCWMLMLVLGAGVFGVIPATSTLLLIFRRFMNKGNKTGLTDFFCEWCKELVVSNVVGLPIILMMFSLGWYLHWALGSDTEILQLLSLAILPLLAFLMMLLSASILQGSIFRASAKQRWRLALSLLRSHPSLPFTLILVSALCVLVGLFSPIVFLLFGITPAALLVLAWYIHKFPDLNKSN